MEASAAAEAAVDFVGEEAEASAVGEVGFHPAGRAVEDSLEVVIVHLLRLAPQRQAVRPRRPDRLLRLARRCRVEEALIVQLPVVAEPHDRMWCIGRKGAPGNSISGLDLSFSRAVVFRGRT